MRNQAWSVAVLIGAMCLIRLGLGAIGYTNPPWLMEQLGAPIGSNVQMPYAIRVWAIRDIVLAVLVAASSQSTVKPLLFACLVIDLTDILSAHLSGAAGLFSAADTWSLKLTAIAALVLELPALALIMRQKHQEQLRD